MHQTCHSHYFRHHSQPYYHRLKEISMERYLQLRIAHELGIGMCVTRSATAVAEFVEGIIIMRKI